MKQPPLVSVICLCYQHADFVTDTLKSVWQQDYPNIEVIIVDDASSDDSVSVIQNYLIDHPCPFPLKTLFLQQNLGNCAAFNRAWQMAKGEYIIDLATDDIMLPQRVSSQIAYFQQLPNDYGVVFSEAQYIDHAGKPLAYHFAEKYPHIRPVPTGNVYSEVLSRYFIPSPTMMYKNEVLQHLGGYDEQLAYEDFDFWVQSARFFKYAYLDKCTTLVRKSPASMSRGWYQKGDAQLYSTFLVCLKARALNRTLEEQKALIKRVKFEIRQAVFSDNRKEARLFFKLLEEIHQVSGFYRFLYVLSRMKIKLSWLRNLYLRLRY